MKFILFTILLPSFSFVFGQNPGIPLDTTVYSVKSAIVQGNKYIAVMHKNGFVLLNGKADTLVKLSEIYFSSEFKDFNEDGYKDLFLDKGGNTPERYDLFLYSPQLKKFKPIRNFEMFPAPLRIEGTRYFYSYHKNGCADLDWVSDLFYIRNFEAESIGKIDGVGCGTDKTPTAIYIYSINKTEKNLLTIFTINTIDTYKENKWGFIKEYWQKNYKNFIK